MSIIFSPSDIILCQNIPLQISISNFVESIEGEPEEQLIEDAFYILSSYYTGRVVFGGSEIYAFAVYFEDDDYAAFGVTWKDALSAVVHSGEVNVDDFVQIQNDGEALVAFLSENKFFNAAFKSFQEYVMDKIAD